MNVALESLVRPGIRLLQVVRLPLKFAIISAAFVIPLGVAEGSAAIQFATARTSMFLESLATASRLALRVREEVPAFRHREDRVIASLIVIARLIVIPAQAGIQFRRWIRACADDG